MATRFLFALPFLLASPALAEPITPSIRAMVERAAQSEDQAKIDAVVAVAKEMHPESSGEIDTIIAAAASKREAARQERMASAGFFDNWTGSGELGGSIATGNSDTVTATAGLNLNKESRNWRHTITALADLQRSDGENAQERYAAGYKIERNLSERLYVLGTLGWERNAVSGLRSRFTEALGLGYKLIDNPGVTWRLEGGPALRQAKFVDRDENGVAFRAASDFGWAITPNTQFSQITSAYLEGGSSSILSSTALTAGLGGAFSARMSFNVQYESDPPVGDKHTDTVTRATLVYGF